MNIMTARGAQSQQEAPLPKSAQVAGPSGAQGSITCVICGAVYAPAPLQRPFLHYAENALEAAFMSACHFCFRCRRPSCPQCWDEVHGICGACVSELYLPFRCPPAPLPGMLYPPVLQSVPAQKTDTEQSLLILVYPGRFGAQPAPVADPAVAVPPVAMSAPREMSHTPHSGPASVKIRQAGTFTLKRMDDGVVMDVPKMKESALQKPAKSRRMGRLEGIVTWLLFCLLLMLVALIVLAECLPGVNDLVLRYLHIDIRGEIAYLARIVQQMFTH